MTPLRAFCLAGTIVVAAAGGDSAGSDWTRVGPWNIFKGTNPTVSAGMGEAGTLASAASPAANPDLIYAGGHNNGMSSGVLKTVNGGVHWTRNSKGMWDTRINGVWLHPDDPQGNHVFAGTATGIYESKDGAESWQLANETKEIGGVVSFREAVISGEKYIIANADGGYILTRAMAGGLWQKIKAPNGMPPNMELSVVITAGKTEVFVCIYGKLYYGALDTPTTITWTEPIKSQFNGTTTDNSCANAAVDPNDRNHFMYSASGVYHMRYSKDGGKTVDEYTHVDTRKRLFQTYFVLIDQTGRLYSSTQSGSFVSEDKGVTWNPLHVMISCAEPKCAGAGNPSDQLIDRIPHDFQNIIPNFRGNGIALPSDQGLHIVDFSSKNYTLTSAVGDLHNSISLSAIISPSKDGKSRNIIVNMWDWDVVASFDDGASWPLWAPDEKAPYACGEGGGGQGIGSSPYQIMFHHSNWFVSSDGGHNYKIGDAPGGATGDGFDYVRQPGSRTAPTGKWFYMMDAPATTKPSSGGAKVSAVEYNATYKHGHGDKKAHAAEKARLIASYTGIAAPPPPPAPSPPVGWMMASTNYGLNFSWTKLPTQLGAGGQEGAFIVDPTSANSLYVLTPTCLAHSTDDGQSWSGCSKATGLTGSFTKLLVKDSTTMFMFRTGAVPLRTKDGGSTWTALTSTAPLFVGQATFKGSLSWTGKTLVIYGNDRSAISRDAFGTAVWKSSDDGETWADETGDLVTISTGKAVWYENDFYFPTAGEGIVVKRNFE